MNIGKSKVKYNFDEKKQKEKESSRQKGNGWVEKKFNSFLNKNFFFL